MFLMSHVKFIDSLHYFMSSDLTSKLRPRVKISISLYLLKAWAVIPNPLWK